MSINKYQPHVMVLPEDDANRQLANGFVLDLDPAKNRKIQVIEEAGGWIAVLDRFTSDQVTIMNSNQDRFVVLLIDFDGKDDRLERAMAVVPGHLRDRVFVLGVRTEPEDLKPDFGPDYEAIGMALARDCRDATDTTWGHHLLRHNATEIARLREHVRPILF